MTLDANAPVQDDEWAAARAAAVTYRRSRLYPPARQVWADRWLRPIFAVVWLATTVVAVAAIVDQVTFHDVLYLAGSVGVVLTLGLGLWWLVVSRRYLLRGSNASIRAALPVGARRDVQRQLNGKRPVDPANADVLLELAYQQHRLLAGQAAFVAIYIPLLLSEAADPRNVLAIVLAGIATAAFVVVAVSLVLIRQRRSAVIDQLDPDRTVVG